MHCEFCLIQNHFYFITRDWVEMQSEGNRFPNTAAHKFYILFTIFTVILRQCGIRTERLRIKDFLIQKYEIPGGALVKKWKMKRVKKSCAAKVLPVLWDIFLHEKNRNYHSYRFSYKFSFIFFLFSYKPKIRIRFSASWWSGTEKYFCFLFIASRALLQSHAQFNRIL